MALAVQDSTKCYRIRLFSCRIGSVRRWVCLVWLRFDCLRPRELQMNKNISFQVRARIVRFE